MSGRLTLDRTVSVIESHLGIADREITEGTLFFEELAADSLDRVELQFALEEELGEDLTVAEQELDEIRTVGDLIRILNALLDDA